MSIESKQLCLCMLTETRERQSREFPLKSEEFRVREFVQQSIHTIFQWVSKECHQCIMFHSKWILPKIHPVSWQSPMSKDWNSWVQRVGSWIKLSLMLFHVEVFGAKVKQLRTESFERVYDGNKSVISLLQFWSIQFLRNNQNSDDQVKKLIDCDYNLIFEY